MLTSKAIKQLGHTLVDAALNAIIIAEMYNISLFEKGKSVDDVEKLRQKNAQRRFRSIIF